MNENNLIYRTRLLSTKYQSYPHDNLNIVITDYRLIFHDITSDNNNIPYDSDHNAVKILISFNNENELELRPRVKNYKNNLKNINWKKFRKTFKENLTTNIPNDRNLTIQEIHEYLQKTDAKILKAMEKTISKVKKKILLILI